MVSPGTMELFLYAGEYSIGAIVIREKEGFPLFNRLRQISDIRPRRRTICCRFFDTRDSRKVLFLSHRRRSFLVESFIRLSKEVNWTRKVFPSYLFLYRNETAGNFSTSMNFQDRMLSLFKILIRILFLLYEILHPF